MMKKSSYPPIIPVIPPCNPFSPPWKILSGNPRTPPSVPLPFRNWLNPCKRFGNPLGPCCPPLTADPACPESLPAASCPPVLPDWAVIQLRGGDETWTLLLPNFSSFKDFGHFRKSFFFEILQNTHIHLLRCIKMIRNKLTHRRREYYEGKNEDYHCPEHLGYRRSNMSLSDRISPVV